MIFRAEHSNNDNATASSDEPGLLHEIVEHSKKTWSAVSDGTATPLQYGEAGLELAAGTALIKFAQAGLFRAGDDVVAAAESTESRTPSTSFAMNNIRLQANMEQIIPIEPTKPFVGPDFLTMKTDLSGSKFPLTLRGADLKYPVNVGGQERFATVHLPPTFTHEKSTSVFFLADGAQYNDPAGEMLHGYHWSETADRNNFIAVALEQSPKSEIEISNRKLLKLVPRNTAWRTPFAFLNASSQVDDMEYFASVHKGVTGAVDLKPDAINFVGFCDGGVFGHALASKVRFNGLATIASSRLTEITPPPLPGIKSLFTTFENDPIIPPAGGPGRAFGRFLKKLGHDNIANSKPLEQAPAYAKVNGLLPEAVNYTEDGSERIWSGGSGRTSADAIEISKAQGGHNWPGTLYDSATLTVAKQVSPETALNFNQRIVDWFKE